MESATRDEMGECLRACKRQQLGQSVPFWELRFGVVDCDYHETPLWERLPRDLQEHVGRFLAQKMLWVFLSFGTPRWLDHRMSEDEFVRIVDTMRRACPTFHRTLRTVHLLCVPTSRWTHHETFGRGLVRLAWELYDHDQIDAQGAAHISCCWTRPHVTDGEANTAVKRRLMAIAKQAYESGRSRVLPQHYLQAIEHCMHTMMLADRTLRWVHGCEREAIERVLLSAVNAPWTGRTETSQMRNRKVLRRTMDDALNSLRALQQPQA